MTLFAPMTMLGEALFVTQILPSPSIANFEGIASPPLVNPVGGESPVPVKTFKEQRRKRYLSPEELQKVNIALLEEPDWRWRAYFPLALMPGTRRSELLAMRWAAVDLTARTWRIPAHRG
jgi:integrase